MTRCPQSPTGFCQLTVPCEKPCNGVTMFMCGPNSKCQHDYSGWQDIVIDGQVRGGTAVCKKCGRTAFDEAAWD